MTNYLRFIQIFAFIGGLYFIFASISFPWNSIATPTRLAIGISFILCAIFFKVRPSWTPIMWLLGSVFMILRGTLPLIIGEPWIGGLIFGGILSAYGYWTIRSEIQTTDLIKKIEKQSTKEN